MIIDWLPKAIELRDKQLDFIAEKNKIAAVEQGDRIQEQVNQLAQFPELGKIGRRSGTREVVISKTPFIMVYRYISRKKRIEIMRVLHTSLDY